MGKLVDWKKGIIRGLAFFPVVAISSNLSTKILRYKGNKNKWVSKIFCRTIDLDFGKLRSGSSFTPVQWHSQ